MYKEETAKKKQKIPKEFLFLLFSMIISCIIVYVFSRPLYINLKARDLEVEIKKNNIESRELVLSRVIRINENDEYNTGVEKMENIVSDRNNYEAYLANIVDIAKRKNIIISELQVLDSEENFNKDNVGVTPNSGTVNIVAVGEMSNFIDFLEYIEDNIPLMQVDSIEIDKTKGDGIDLDSVLSFSVIINFFYY